MVMQTRGLGVVGTVDIVLGEHAAFLVFVRVILSSWVQLKIVGRTCRARESWKQMGVH